MFRGLINDVKAAAGSVVSKYAVRASVAVPFVIAAGFATAGVTLWLIDYYGAQKAYFIVAGGFVTLGLIAAILVQSREQVETVADTKAAAVDTASVATEAVAAAAEQLPLAMLGTLLTSQLSPEAIISLDKGLGRNAPLVLLVAALGVLLWPNLVSTLPSADPDPVDARDPVRTAANGAYHPNELRDAA